MHVTGLWEEARVPRENMQTPHRKVPHGIQTQDRLAVSHHCATLRFTDIKDILSHF